MRRSAASRRGAALIIALVVLAALLMLGLPFLFTQSASLTGTRSFAQNQQAKIGHQSAESLGIAIAASAVAYHLQTGATPQDDWISLYWGLGGSAAKEPHLGPLSQNPSTAPAPAAALPNPNHVGIDLSTLGLGSGTIPAFPYVIPPGAGSVGSTSTIGLVLEDEAGKLDPNSMDAVDWATLFGAVGISDWPADGSTGAAVPGNYALCQALALLRYPPTIAGQPGVGGRITVIEQLQLANPQLSAPSARGPLTVAELDLLRPHLTLSARASGRAGPRNPDPGYQLSGALVSPGVWANPVSASDLTLVDLGTLLTTGGGVQGIDSLPPSRMAAFPVSPNLFGDGTAMVIEDKTTTNASGVPLQIEHLVPAWMMPTFTAGLPVEAPLGLAVGPALNLHQADGVVCAVLNQVTPANPVNQTTHQPALPVQPAPDSLANTNGLTNAIFQCANTFPQGTGTHSAFALLDPLSSTVVLAQGIALPGLIGDPGIPPGSPSMGVYSASQDTTMAWRPTLPASALVIHVQGASSFSELPSSGWAQLSGVQAPGLVPVTEYVQYSSVNVNSPSAGVTTIAVSRGQTYQGTGSPPTTFFTDSTPTSLPPTVPPTTPLTITFFGPHELPPLAIASRGTVTIEASATIIDPSGHQVASRARRVVAQALPQEYQLEERWQKQSQLHALIASRQGSLMTSFPRPYPRLSDIFPVDTDLASNSTLDSVIGMRPAVLRTLTSSWLSPDWTLPLSGPSVSFLTSVTYPNVNQPGQQTPGSMPVSPATAGAGFASQMTPEGLLCSPVSGTYLAYQVSSGDHGLLGLTDSVPTSSPPPPTPNLEIPSRQIGLWVRPNASWSGTTPVTILEMRMPINNAGLPYSCVPLPNASNPQSDQRLDATAGVGQTPDTTLQNYWSLWYDASVSGQEQLVLSFANAAIEHEVDYGPLIPGYDPTSTHVDNRALGGGTLPLAPMRPANAATNPRGGNRIECRYHYTLTPGTWHLIQVAYTRDTPGSQAITVDGLVGRDIARSGTMTMVDPGDHITLPCMILNQSLPAIPYPTTPIMPNPATSLIQASGGSDTTPGHLQVQAWSPTGGGAADLIPSSGYVLIGNEYFSYTGLISSGNGVCTLTGCMRGQRQNTDIANPLLPAQAWPTMLAHAVGDLVVPGGYRLHLPNTTLLRGGCTLAGLNGSGSNGFWYGDPVNNYVLWGKLAASQPGDGTPGAIPPGSPPTDSFVYPQPTTLHIAQSYGDSSPPGSQNGTWPIRGYARLVVQASLLSTATQYLFYYDNSLPSSGPSSGIPPSSTNLTFTNVVALTLSGSSWTPGPWNAALQDFDITLNPLVVEMLSCQLNAPAGLDATRFNMGSGSLSAPGSGTTMVQFYQQAVDGAVEWLSYNWITTGMSQTGSATPGNPPYYFLVNFSGFPWSGFGVAGNQRAVERTRAPIDSSGNVLTPFPAGSRVLPVQSGYSGVIRTGDVVTIVPGVCRSTARSSTSPSGYSANTVQGTNVTTQNFATWQAVVRYSPMDGFGTVSSDVTTWNGLDDTQNQLFAFTEELPAVFPSSPSLDLVCWPGWNGTDLSPSTAGPPLPPYGLLTSVPSLLPYSNAFASGFLQSGTTDDRRLYIASPDDRTPNLPTPLPILQGAIDAVEGGRQSAVPLVATEVAGIDTVATETITPVDGVQWIADTTLGAIQGVTIQPSNGLSSPGPYYGLVLIGGEVFAYRLHTNQLTTPPSLPGNLDLIGRGLLGSIPRIHTGRENLVILPIGPVSPLNGTLSSTSEGLLPIPGTMGVLDAPALLITSPDGQTLEALAAPNGYTGPWLRGLYDTCAPDLAGKPAWSADAATGLYPIAIGYWPRYASALPNTGSPQWTGLTANQQSAALRCRSFAWAAFPLRFYDQVFPSTDALGSVSLFDDAGQQFTLFARALASGFDWNRTDVQNAQVTLPAIPVPAIAGSLPEAAAVVTAIDPTFVSDQFQPVPSGGTTRQATSVDGAEVRVFWRYTTYPIAAPTQGVWFNNLANQANSAPTLGPAVLRCRAPAKVIAVESAR